MVIMVKAEKSLVTEWIGATKDIHRDMNEIF